MAANIVEPPAGAPPLRQAFSLTRYSSVSLMSPCLIARKTTSAVISFIMLDGARSSSAFFSNNTLPLEASIRIAVGASPSKPPSSFLAPCTLLLAALTMPAQPTAASRAAARTPGQKGLTRAGGLREVDVFCAMDGALNRVLTGVSTANNSGSPERCGVKAGQQSESVKRTGTGFMSEQVQSIV